LISACKGRGTDIKKPADASDIKALDSSSIKKALRNVYFMFPSPVEILTAINQGGLVYKPELLNSIENREKYVKPNDQYLNLGVYLADFSYCALFARNNDAEVYLETIKKLSDEVSLSTEIDKGLIEKVKNKVNTVDSLVKITDEFFFKVVNDLEGNYRHNDVAIISIGAYIECLYLSINNVNKYSEESLLIRKIAEQKYAFNILYQYCKKHISNEDLIKSFSYIKQINDAFGQFSEHKEMVKVKKVGNSRLLISGGSTSVVTEAEFKAFKKNITKIRNSITK
jgi:hypothetical protein